MTTTDYAVDYGTERPLVYFSTEAQALSHRDTVRSVGYTSAEVLIRCHTHGLLRRHLRKCPLCKGSKCAS